MEQPNKTRRDLLKTLAASAALAATASVTAGVRAQTPAATPARAGKSVVGLTAAKLDTVRVGFIGVGNRGSFLINQLTKIDGVEVKAVSDIVPRFVERAQNYFTKAGKPKPDGYSDGLEDFKKIADRDDIDLLFIATPWNWHVPMAVEAMTKGKHAFVEVPAATTLEDCWKLVDTSEATQKHCVMMENCCFSPEALMMLNLTRQGLLGDLLYGEGGYIHDLRSELFSGKGEGLWRIDQHVNRDGNLYPTHGLGPIAQCMGINRSDRFEYLTSMSSPSLGFQDFARGVPDGHKWKNGKFACGDINTSMIKTAQGRTVVVQHDVSNPTPYSRIDCLRGTKGVFMGYPDRIYIEGKSKKHDEFDDLEAWDAYQHPMWKKLEAAAIAAGGHGGMDFVMQWRLFQCLREGLPMDMDVYDAAAWSAVGPISEMSVKNRSSSIDFPDFTRGAYKTVSPLAVASV